MASGSFLKNTVTNENYEQRVAYSFLVFVTLINNSQAVK